MSRNHLKLAGVLASVLCAACSAPPSGTEGSASGRHYGQIEFTPCTLTGAVAAANVEALCGTFSVPENLFRKITDEERADWQQKFSGIRT